RTSRLLALFAGLVLVRAATLSAAEPSPFGHSTGGWSPPLTSMGGGSDAGRLLPVSAEQEPSSESSSPDDESPDVADLEKRLKEMEDAWSDFQNEREKEQQEAESKPTLEIGGRIHADYWAYPHASE